MSRGESSIGNTLVGSKEDHVGTGLAQTEWRYWAWMGQRQEHCPLDFGVSLIKNQGRNKEITRLTSLWEMREGQDMGGL